MTKDVYKPFAEGHPYTGTFKADNVLTPGEELRALLQTPKLMQTVDQIIGSMLRGQPMNTYPMPAPYEHMQGNRYPLSGAEPYTMNMTDVQKMFQKTPQGWQSHYPNLVPNQTESIGKPMPNPALDQAMPRMLGKPLLPPPGGIILGPDSQPMSRPPGLEVPQGMRVGPDGEELVPDTYYNIPEDPNAEDV